MLGGISGLIPTSVVVIGAGTVGEYACRTSLGLGASVIVFDNSITKLRRLQNNINQRISTSTLQPKALGKALQRADVVIAALQNAGGKALSVVSEEMVSSMKPNSVIIDASISQGGCFETSRVTSHESPTFVKHDVIHYCVPNIGARVSRTSSRALSYLWTPILLQMAQNGGVENMMASKNWFMKGVYSYKGYLTNANIARKFGVQFKDLELLLCGRM